jgi:hypothetical protein
VSHPELDSGMGELDTIQLAVVIDTVTNKLIPLFRITMASRARTFVILTMDLGDNQGAGHWADRWIELAHNGDKSWQDAVWHKAVLCQRLEKWVEMMHWCDALVNANPDYPEVVPLRNFAKKQLTDLLNENTE